MKKLFVLALILSLFVFVVPAKAMETVTYTGMASWNNHFVVHFVTLRPGNIAATAYFILANKWYKIRIENDADFTITCNQLIDDRYGQNNADKVGCMLFNAPAGSYTAEFWLSSGKTNVSMEITAETNP